MSILAYSTHAIGGLLIRNDLIYECRPGFNPTCHSRINQAGSIVVNDCICAAKIDSLLKT
jgi:hypothetical protein